MLTQTTRLDQTVQLADGRVLGYAEYGPAGGPPLLVFHGLPGSRLAVPEMWPGEPGAVRVIAPDRPGMGTSAFQPGRRLTDWADDVRQLADSLGIQRFGVAGFSGGGPHALAVAHGLPDRVIAVGSIAGAGPIGTRDARRALRHASPVNRLIFALARTAPALLWPVIAQHARAVRRHPAKVIDSAARDRSLPEADRQAMTGPGLRERMMAAASEAFRQGVRGAIHEARICARPWGFDPAAIKPPVRLWHGDQDANAPVAMAWYLAERIPGSSLTVYPGEGHLIVPKHWDDILAALLSEYPRPGLVGQERGWAQGPGGAEAPGGGAPGGHSGGPVAGSPGRGRRATGPPGPAV
jgi:pimeloyl-ACP methyl ester carboxylesterase